MITAGLEAQFGLSAGQAAALRRLGGPSGRISRLDVLVEVGTATDRRRVVRRAGPQRRTS